MSKKLVYAIAAADVAAGFLHRNPVYFEKAEPDVSEVLVVGDFPAIVEAYKAADGCTVKTATPKAEKAAAKAEKAKKPTKAEQEAAAAKAEAERLEAERAAQRSEIEAMDEDGLKEILVGMETDKDGETHTITEDDLADLDVETLRSMALEAVFIEA